MKKIFAALLVLVLALVLTPERAAKAEGMLCPQCNNPLYVEWGSKSTHLWRCNSCGYKKEEDHTLDKNCWCSVCEHYGHNLKSIGYDVHTPPTCTEPGLDYDSYLYLCRDCGNYTNNYGSIVNPITADALGHDLVHHDARPATCTEVGWETEGDACSRCSDLNDGMIPALGHSWDTGWTSDGGDTHWHKCLNGCLERDGEENHTPETVPAVPATCDEGGLSEYTRCSKCEMLLSDQEEYMRLGHQLTPVAKVEPSCTAPGTEAYWKCTRDGCGKLFSDADGKNETSLEALTIPALGHDWATELTKGETTHYYACSRCDERKDEAAHTGGTATCKAKAKCTVCGGAYGELAEHQYHPNVWYHDENDHWHRCNVCDQDSPHEAHSGGTPTCTEKGMCEICGSRYVNALGHEIVFTEPVYPTCTEPGIMRHYECTRCGKPFMDSAGTREGMVMPARGHQLTAVAKVEPTCTTPGTEAYWQCTRDGCGKLFSDAEGKNEITAPVAIEALGHQLSPVAKVEPTCTDAGTEAYWQCTRCDKLFSDAEGKNEITAPVAIEALGHLLTIVEKVKPTCTTPGNEAYWKCTRCNKLFSEFIDGAFDNEITAPVAIEALGHNWSEWVVVAEPQAGIPGVKIRVCDRCKECQQKKIANTSEPLDDLVQDQAGQAVPYRMEAVDTPAGKAVVVAPDVDQNAQRPTLCLTQEVVEKWLEEGFTFTWFVNGEATLEIDLHKLDFEWFFPNIGDMDAQSKAPVLISTWSNGEELGVLVNALTATMERVSVTGLNGLTLRIGDTIVDVTLDAEGKFTYTLVS